jgi:hypothetical protein
VGVWTAVQAGGSDQAAIIKVSLPRSRWCRLESDLAETSPPRFSSCAEISSRPNTSIRNSSTPSTSSRTSDPCRRPSPRLQTTTGSTSAAANAAAKIAGSNHAHANVFMPEKKRRHREGYAEGDYTLFHAASAEDFVKGTDPVSLLGMMNKIEFVSDEEKS